MIREDDLFHASRYPDRPGFVGGVDTSEQAADSLDGSTLSRLRKHVFNAILASGVHGMTCDEVEVRLRLRHQTASARVRELSLKGFIADTGQRRLTRSGRRARVYCWARIAP